MDSEFPQNQSQPPSVPVPPVITPVQPVPRPQPKGRGWMFLSLFLGAILLLIVVGKIIHFSASLMDGGNASVAENRGMLESVIENKHAKDKIVVVDVAGVITSSPAERGEMDLVHMIKKQLQMAADDDAVKAVILKVDSPGGEVLASDEIYNLIRDFQTKNDKPVIASMGGMAASGGYYVSAPCRWIVANELTLTGSIGVIMPSYNYRGLMDKVGIRPEVYKSGKFKDMLSGSKREEDISLEERQMVQGLIDETFKKFKSVVAEGRKKANKENKGEGRVLADNWQDFADGRVLSGKQALEHGFVDELGDFDTAVQRTQKIAGIRSANLVRYVQPFDLSNLFRFLGKTEVPTIKVDLGMEGPKLQAGQLYFLSGSVLH